MKELLQLRVFDARCAETEHHLGCQRIGVSPDMVDEQVGFFQEAHQHSLVFEFLIWNVRSGRFDVQVVVNNFTNHAPGFAVFLTVSAYSIQKVPRGHDCKAYHK